MSPSSGAAKDSEQEESSGITISAVIEAAKGSDKPPELIGSGQEELPEKPNDDPMDEDSVTPAIVFCIRLKQPRSNLLHKMSVPELCRKFRCFFLVECCL